MTNAGDETMTGQAQEWRAVEDDAGWCIADKAGNKVRGRVLTEVFARHVSRIETTNATLTRDLAQARADVETAAQTHLADEIVLELVKEERDALRDEVRGLQTQLAQARAEAEDVGLTLDSMTRTAGEYQEMWEAAEAQLVQARAEVEDVAATAHMMGHASRNDEVRALQAQLAQAREALEEYESSNLPPR